MKPDNKNITIYQSNDGKISFNVSVFADTVWLTQKQMAELFDKNRKTITEHIGNIFKEGELEEKVVCWNFQHTTEHGAIAGKVQEHLVKYYNLDVIISVGYRVKSKRGTQFRQWATNILKQYMMNGFAINEVRIRAIEEKIDNLSVELRAEFKTEIKEIHKDLLKIANRPINISNQIRIGSDTLENKIIEMLDELITQIKSKKKLKNQLEEIKEIIKKSPKDQETQNRIQRFFKEIGDNNSDLHKTIKGLGITKKIITELVKLGEKMRDLIL
jgi:hypothetical protein